MEQARVRRFRSQLRRLERVLTDQLEECYCCTGVSVAQCHLMLELEEVGPTHLQALADGLRLDKSTVSRTVDGLARLGLVDREPDLGDRRYSVIRLTGKGAEVCAALNRTCDGFYSEVFAAIPASQHEEVVRSVGVLAKALAATPAPDDVVFVSQIDGVGCETGQARSGGPAG
jgi:DNA-binding MarR family transcriptional regulator